MKMASWVQILLPPFYNVWYNVFVMLNAPSNNSLYDLNVSANDKDQPYATNDLCKLSTPKQWQGESKPLIRACECKYEKQVLPMGSFLGNGLLVDVAIIPTSKSTNDLTKICCISNYMDSETLSNNCCYHLCLPIDLSSLDYVLPKYVNL